MLKRTSPVTPEPRCEIFPTGSCNVPVLFNTVLLLLIVSVPVAAPMSIAVAAPAKLTVVAVVSNKLNVDNGVVMSASSLTDPVPAASSSKLALETVVWILLSLTVI